MANPIVTNKCRGRLVFLVNIRSSTQQADVCRCPKMSWRSQCSLTIIFLSTVYPTSTGYATPLSINAFVVYIDDRNSICVKHHESDPDLGTESFRI